MRCKEMSAPDNARIEQDALTEAVARASKSPKVRTLKEPPEIWDVVHETRTEFKPGSAFVGRLKAIHPVAWAVILLLIAGGGVFGLITLRSRPESLSLAKPSQTAASKPDTVLSPEANPSNTTASSLPDQPPDPPPAKLDANEIKTDEPTIAAAPAAASSDSKVAAKPRPQNFTNSTTATGETVAATGNKHRAQSSSLTTAGNASLARPVNKEVSQPSAATGPKSDKENAPNSTAAKKQTDKGLSPQLIAPAKAGASPKAKVIAWP